MAMDTSTTLRQAMQEAVLKDTFHLSWGIESSFLRPIAKPGSIFVSASRRMLQKKECGCPLPCLRLIIIEVIMPPIIISNYYGYRGDFNIHNHHHRNCSTVGLCESAVLFGVPMEPPILRNHHLRYHKRDGSHLNKIEGSKFIS